jgi:hypothetical protein
VRLPTTCAIRGALLAVLGCALIVALSRDVTPDARSAGQLGVMAAWGALVALHVGGHVVFTALKGGA